MEIRKTKEESLRLVSKLVTIYEKIGDDARDKSSNNEKDVKKSKNNADI